MIKLKDILLEGRRSMPISMDEAIEIALARCTEWKTYYTDIYRGIASSKPFHVVHPAEHKRRSIQTENYYTLIIDNDPQWSAFPKRSKSIICSTSYTSAKGYSGGGTPYKIIPFDGSQWGICPDSDIWISFMQNYKSWMYFGNDTDAEGINEILNISYEVVNEKKLDDVSYQKFKRQLSSVQYIDINELDAKIKLMNSADKAFLFDKTILSFAEEFNSSNSTLYEFVINHVYAPNKFELQSYPIRVDENKEIWSDTPALMISADHFDEFYDELKVAREIG